MRQKYIYILKYTFKKKKKNVLPSYFIFPGHFLSLSQLVNLVHHNGTRFAFLCPSQSRSACHRAKTEHANWVYVPMLFPHDSVSHVSVSDAQTVKPNQRSSMFKTVSHPKRKSFQAWPQRFWLNTSSIDEQGTTALSQTRLTSHRHWVKSLREEAYTRAKTRSLSDSPRVPCGGNGRGKIDGCIRQGEGMRDMGAARFSILYLQLQEPECLTSRTRPKEQAACLTAHSLG